MASILVTGSTDGVGRNTAEALLGEGHRVAVHARTTARLANIQHLPERGAESVLGDLGDLDQVHGLVEQVNALGRFDAVVHIAGVTQGPVAFRADVDVDDAHHLLIEAARRAGVKAVDLAEIIVETRTPDGPSASN
jgi:NAD(P)-dependent dehydrogenase (short-subunit alcohol dehydrogenase family)